MIPSQLVLKNFLSYRQARIDFRGLHVACIAGPNGAGKSSLLEAIAWAVWGQSRAAAEDDVIHMGELETLVDFVFEHNQQCYRIVRSRRRSQGSTLEFQMQVEGGFRALTQRGMRATQQLICQYLKLDYDTFVNSAYLRQGRADEFMLKRPAERKQILADVLKLDRYDELADRAKEKSREAKAAITVLQTSLETLETQLQQRSQVVQNHHDLQANLAQLDHQQQQLRETLAQRRQQQQQYQQQCHHLSLLKQQLQQQQRDLDRFTTNYQARLHQLEALQQVIAEAAAIAQGYQHYQQLQQAEQKLGERFQRYQQLQPQLQQLEQEQQTAQQAVSDRQRQLQIQLTSRQEQLQELEPILAKATAVEETLPQLQTAKEKLRQLDDLQLQVTPLLQRRQTLQRQLDQAQTRIQTRLEELHSTAAQLATQQAQQPQLQQAMVTVTRAIGYLEKRRAYQEQVREKGLERRSFMERLQANQRTYELQLGQIDQKLQMLSNPDAVCPLCDRPLDEHHWQLVLERHRLQQKELQDQLWVIREQLTTSQREIQVLRQEYREIEAELASYSTVLQQRGHLAARVSSTQDMQTRLQQLEAEQQQLEACLQANTFAGDIHQELYQLDQTLAKLNYDDRNHALARGLVDRLRWAEIKQGELQQARHRQQKLLSQIPELERQLAEIKDHSQALQHHPRQQQIQQLQQQLAALNYSFENHQQLRRDMEAAQVWVTRHQALQQAQQQLPELQAQLEVLAAQQQTCQTEVVALENQVHQLSSDLELSVDYEAAIQQLEQQLQSQRQQRDQAWAEVGALQQQLQQLDQMQQQLVEQQETLAATRQQRQVYEALAQAFGRNGIQALMIENLLPQLEAETNHLLSRLSNHQLHVQFVTQRASRRQHKLIDTLDILIADSHGTRPYETYSGGEAFRVNFAIRLALARLLAQRSGMALQMLIIDEGFGTQDQEGCGRLISAIEAIADDFACILAVTHIPHFREAFQTRIDILKTEEGSQVMVS
jgi:exonuclease SbcC